MIKVGAIRKIWKGWRLLLFAFVDDNSSLKSRFILKEKCIDGKQYLTVGKGVRKDVEVVKLCVCTNSICSHYKNKSMVWIGIGKWDIISYNFSSSYKQTKTIDMSKKRKTLTFEDVYKLPFRYRYNYF